MLPAVRRGVSVMVLICMPTIRQRMSLKGGESFA
jgi:hypothetical protein